MWPFSKQSKPQTTVGAMRQGIEIGADTARRHPELSVEDILRDADRLIDWVKAQPTETLNQVISDLGGGKDSDLVQPGLSPDE